MGENKVIVLEFGKYTDVTDMAKEMDGDFYGQYEKVFVCIDTNNSWVCKVLTGYDEEYNNDDSKVLVERNNIDDYSAKRHLKLFKPEALTRKVLKADIDDGCNWDVVECDSVDDAIEAVDGGYGIN